VNPAPDDCFRTITVVDFEYEVFDGDAPKPLCMVAMTFNHEFELINAVRLWRGQFLRHPPFDIGPDALICGYSLQAEMQCFISLGWPFPEHLLCQHTAHLSTTNILLPYDPDETRTKQRKRLSDACRRYGIEGWENIDKEEISKDIGEGRWHLHGREAVLRYCEEDVRKTVELLGRQITGYRDIPPIDVERVISWSRYSGRTVAQIQHKGMPIDTALWDLVQENEQAIITALLQKFDPTFGQPDSIWTPDGEWSDARFERWLVKAGIAAWPRLSSGKIQIDGDAFRMMIHIHPAIEGMHALRDALGVIVRARFPIGSDGRNRPSLFPFGTATGRNAQAKSLFNAHASMRSFMKFDEGGVAVYLDWRTQEVGVAAALSGDPQLIADYQSGDVYHALAVMCGLTNDSNPKRWKVERPDQRDRMKPLQLGINYGMGVRSLSRGLGRHPLIGGEIIMRHNRRYPVYWDWREQEVQRAMLARKIVCAYDGWALHLSHSPNKRTLYNFPMQSGGAAMLRVGANRLCDAGVVPSMLVHDGILLELQSNEQVQHALEIMRKAGAETCNGLEIGADVDFDQRQKGARFIDKRPIAKKMWATIMDVLILIGAIRETAA
jgi:DNA polymerase-1